ncbi:polyamine ABC transporter ATP-binding protein [Rhizobium phaseoli]|uniref:Spermidine/putrescine import ATP-binding protein PotA n=1 Tax=Rhizobium phaseoli TaxID=396 RepID=A0A7K3U9L2_9HYPH|nr:ABC transporter ATP-binding protein [Rhizobium phaseoli]NEJ69568.1 polyamine ABC transporter ATP-binding protein [Rhizobium phaseoli]
MSNMTPLRAAKGGAVTILSVLKDFGNFRAVNDVSIEIRPNEFFTLLGPSGCGKTTLLRMLAGFEAPSDGKILLDGTDISMLPPNKRPINTVFQNYALFPHMTVAENIGFGLKMLGKSAAEISSSVEEMLRLVRLENAGNRSVTQLSGGQQQRVALARALAPKPKLLLLDEPLSALDLKLRKSMQIELKRLQQETEITFIFVTHDQEEALTMSDRIAVMNGGKVLQIGSAHDIYEHPADRFVAGFIGETNFLEGDLTSSADGVGTVSLRCGPVVEALTAKSVASSGAVTIVVRPEHLELVAPGSQQAVDATVEQIVYFGTDTHVHARLSDGTALTIRQQNRPGPKEGIAVGRTIGVTIPPRVAQILKD